MEGGNPAPKTVEEAPGYIQYTYQGVLSRAIHEVMTARIMACQDIINNEPRFERALENLWMILPPDVKEAVLQRLGEEPAEHVRKAKKKVMEELGEDIEKIWKMQEACFKKPSHYPFWGPRERCIYYVKTLENELLKDIYRQAFWAATEVFNIIMEELHSGGWLAEMKQVLRGGE